MKVGDVQKRIEGIKEAIQRRDFEVAHGDEDALYKDVLEAISKLPYTHPLSQESVRQARMLARAALKASELRFPRYTA